MNGALDATAAALRADGFAFTPATAMRAALGKAALDAWDALAASWNDLGPDLYMADGGRYRRRRHAVLSADTHGFRRKPRMPHYQSRDYNRLNGGIARWFEPIETTVLDNPAMVAILETSRALFDALTPAGRQPQAWHVELHQFRIETTAGIEGKPTPEGMHRDGVDWVLVLLVARENVASGETTIAADDRSPLGSFTLARALDSAFVDDSRVFHGVTGIVPVDPSRPAWRDVLVVTFRHQ